MPELTEELENGSAASPRKWVGSGNTDLVYVDLSRNLLGVDGTAAVIQAVLPSDEDIAADDDGATSAGSKSRSSSKASSRNPSRPASKGKPGGDIVPDEPAKPVAFLQCIGVQGCATKGLGDDDAAADEEIQAKLMEDGLLARASECGLLIRT